MALARNSNPFSLKEGNLKQVIWTNPQLIGTNATDPLSFASGIVDVGYFKQGTLKIPMNRTYAEFLAGTPAILVRKDLTRKKFGIEIEDGQFDVDVLTLAKGTLTQAGYAITTPSSFNVDLNWIGSDEPTQPFNGYLLETFLTDGTPFYIAMWYGKVTTEDISMNFTGTAHATTKIDFEAFPAPAFAGVANESQKHYGLIWRQP